MYHPCVQAGVRLLVIEHAKLWALLVTLPPKFALSLLRALVEVAPPSQMGGSGTKTELFAPTSPTRQSSTGGGGGGYGGGGGGALGGGGGLDRPQRTGRRVTAVRLRGARGGGGGAPGWGQGKG